MWLLRKFLIVAAVLLGAGTVQAAELVVFETEGCPYCIRWQRDVGEIYHLTDEGKALPLRRVEIAEPIPADLAHIPNVKLTPTFVVVHNGREVGRILGYIGEEQFWGLLGEIIKERLAELQEPVTTAGPKP